jgi:histidyl-tRNA synthetase
VQILDKLDKINAEGVLQELQEKGLSVTQTEECLRAVQAAKPSDRLAEIINSAEKLGVPSSWLEFSPSLARGLDYYTGLIFEGMIPEYTVGSVGGGGRYDQLIEQLAGVPVPAIGFGIGFDRTVEAADQLGLITTAPTTTQVLVTVFNEQSLSQSLEITTKLRQAGIATELYPAQEKLEKQLKLADQKKIPFVVIIGDEEMAQQQVKLRNMTQRTEQLISVAEVIEQLSVKSIPN